MCSDFSLNESAVKTKNCSLNMPADQHNFMGTRTLRSNLKVLAFSPLTGGCSEGLGAFLIFFKLKSVVMKKVMRCIK